MVGMYSWDELQDSWALLEGKRYHFVLVVDRLDNRRPTFRRLFFVVGVFYLTEEFTTVSRLRFRKGALFCASTVSGFVWCGCRRLLT